METPQTLTDDELRAIQAAYAHLRELKPDALERALDYLEARLKAEKPSDKP